MAATFLLGTKKGTGESRSPFIFALWNRHEYDSHVYDVFLISYDEPHADEAFEALRELHPIARRVHGIKGIQAAHQKCAELARTRHFFVVDADNRIDDGLVFEYRVPDYDSEYVHLWYARNPLNGLAYGWGGLKLFPKKLFAGVGEMRLDMTTSFPLKIIPEIVSTSAFNTSPFETWRSAFRECVKLTLAEQNRETRTRLYGWLNMARGDNAEWCLRGAKDGAEYAEQNRSDPPELLRINDYEWLAEKFSG
jgi:hypothetical protein